MYLGGKSHLVFRTITLLNCIFTYSASFQAVSHKEQKEQQQPTGILMDEINSTHFHVARKQHEGTGRQIFYIYVLNAFFLRITYATYV